MNSYNQSPSCSYCGNRDGIFVQNRYASWYIALLLGVLFFTFIVGYFWGKKAATNQYMVETETQAQVDRDHVAAYVAALELEKDSEPVVVATIAPEGVPEVQALTELAGEVEQKDTLVQVDTCPVIQQLDDESSAQQYFAQLIGFGTKRAAQKFVDKLKSKDVPVRLKERTSVSAKGKPITWYQVVTHTFTNRDKLAELVDQLSAQEKLSDVRIVSC